jgi:hypothetical protein
MWIEGRLGRAKGASSVNVMVVAVLIVGSSNIPGDFREKALGGRLKGRISG